MRYPAAVAPFIARYVLNDKAPDASLCLCEDCQMIFCDPRFDDEEMARLYGGYRGAGYTAEREKCEPGYAERNARIARDPGELLARRAFCDGLLRQANIEPDSILDYGGDRGQFIPDRFAASRRFVYEVSGAEPEPGIQAIDQPDARGPYDLVMCCHVLEHVPSPNDMMRTIKNLVAPGGAIYIEVPAGIPTERYFQASLFRGQLARRTQVFHEHVNAFTECSLRNLMLAVGVKPIVMATQFLDYGWTTAPVIGCVGRVGSKETYPTDGGRLSLMLEGLTYGYRKWLSSRGR